MDQSNLLLRGLGWFYSSLRFVRAGRADLSRATVKYLPFTFTGEMIRKCDVLQVGMNGSLAARTDTLRYQLINPPMVIIRRFLIFRSSLGPSSANHLRSTCDKHVSPIFSDREEVQVTIMWYC